MVFNILLDRNNSIPLYEQLKNLISAQIKKGELKPGQQIPSERELCETYQVSRITVRQAISIAENEGLVCRTHGRGTFVSSGAKIKQGLTKVNNFQETLSTQGIVGSTIIHKAEVTPNNFLISHLLGRDMMEQIINLQLIGFGNEEPIVFYDTFFSHSLGNLMIQSAKKAIERNIACSTLDLYREYSDDIGIIPTHAEQTFEASLADEFLANALQVEKGEPIFRVSSIVYADKQPIEYKEAYYRGDKYKFFITRDYQPNN